VNTVITTADVDPAEADAIRDLGVEVILAPLALGVSVDNGHPERSPEVASP
jgi:hypothetical protein